jgi:hypothetical protein
VTEQHDTRREFSAVPVAVVVSAAGLAVFGGVWLGPWAAVIVTVVFALVAIGALVVWAMRRGSLGDAPHVTPVDDGRYRVLVVANEQWVTPRFAEELRAHAGSRPLSIFVMTPALESRMGRLAGDQKGFYDAAERLNDIIERMKRADIEAQGEVGPNDPLQAADDGLRQFAANEIVFVTHPERQESWLESGVIETAKSRYFQPVTHITVARG